MPRAHLEERLRLVRHFGVALGLGLGVLLGGVLYQDYVRRFDDARREGHALADGARRLLEGRLLGIERSLQGLATSMPSPSGSIGSADAERLRQAATALQQLRPEWRGLSLLDAAGQPVVLGSPDPSLRRWGSDPIRPGARLISGPLRQLADGSWAVPLVLPLPAGGWIEVLLAQDYFQEIVDHAARGQHTVMAICDRFDRVVARSHSPSSVIGLPVNRLFTRVRAGSDHVVSQFDGVARVVVVAEPVRYAFWAGAGMAVGQITAPWRGFLGVCLLIYGLYWLGFGFHYVRIRRAELERLASVDELTYRATHDELTGLLRVTELQRRLQRGFARQGTWDVMYLHFRDIDLLAHTYGEAVGQQVLVPLADRVAAALPAQGLAAHQPGDSFVLALPRQEATEPGIGALVELALAPVSVEGQAYGLDPRLGLARRPEHAMHAAELINAAALAAQAPAAQAYGLSLYQPQMAVRARERLSMIGRIREAIGQGQFEVHYQPIYDLRSGQLRKLEALLRWPRGTGQVSPAEFIPLCEESLLIVELGRWVLEQCVADRIALREHGLDALPIAANVSVVQLQRADLAQLLGQWVEAGAITPGQLEIEVTESVLMADSAFVLEQLGQLSGLGVAVSLDDFGTGFSSLQYLRDLPLSALKIDRSFLQRIPGHRRDEALYEELIRLAHSLALRVVAEGVESVAQRQWLTAAGCDEGQGFALARPMSLPALLDTLPALRALQAG